MTTPLSDERIAEMRTREQAATPGPWYPRHRATDCTPDDDERSGLGLEVDGPPEAMLRGQFARAADAAFIAAARADVPDLLAEVERLRAALEAAKPKRPDYGPGTIWTHEGPPPEVWWAEKEATNDNATE